MLPGVRFVGKMRSNVRNLLGALFRITFANWQEVVPAIRRKSTVFESCLIPDRQELMSEWKSRQLHGKTSQGIEGKTAQ